MQIIAIAVTMATSKANGSPRRLAANPWRAASTPAAPIKTTCSHSTTPFSATSCRARDRSVSASATRTTTAARLARKATARQPSLPEREDMAEVYAEVPAISSRNTPMTAWTSARCVRLGKCPPPSMICRRAPGMVAATRSDIATVGK